MNKKIIKRKRNSRIFFLHNNKFSEGWHFLPLNIVMHKNREPMRPPAAAAGIEIFLKMYKCWQVGIPGHSCILLWSLVT
jgi:hypothetical protein